MSDLNTHYSDNDPTGEFTASEKRVMSLLKADALRLNKSVDAAFSQRVARESAKSLRQPVVSGQRSHYESRGSNWAWFGRLAFAASMGLAFVVGLSILQKEAVVPEIDPLPRVAGMGVDDNVPTTGETPDDLFANFQPMLISEGDDFFEEELAAAETIFDTTDLTYDEIASELDAIQLALK